MYLGSEAYPTLTDVQSTHLIYFKCTTSSTPLPPTSCRKVSNAGQATWTGVQCFM